MPYCSRLFQIYMTVRRTKLSRSLLLHLSKFLLVSIYVCGTKKAEIQKSAVNFIVRNITTKEDHNSGGEGMKWFRFFFY